MVYYLIGFLSVVLYAMLGPIAKRLTTGGMPEFVMIGLSMAMLSVIALSVAAFADKSFSFRAITSENWILLGVFALINFTAFSLNLFAYRGVDIIEYQLMALLMPVVGGVLAYFFLGEAFQMKHLLGLAIMGGGLFVALKPA